jgi:hypothetical protein
MKNLHTIGIIALFTVSCGMSLDDEQTKLYKCEKSAMYLSHNEVLMRKAVKWKSTQLSQQIENREDLMKNIGRANNAMSEVMNENGLDKGALRDWYNSEYCTNLLKEYQNYEYGAEKEKEAEIIAKNKDTEEALIRQVLHYSKSMVNTESKEVSCEKFKEQFDIAYKNPSTLKYKDDLEKGLRETIRESLFKLKKFQIDYIMAQVTSDQLENISQEIYTECQNQQLLSDKIGLINSVKFHKSQRSNLINEKLKLLESDNECGDMPEVFCLTKLRRIAVNNAYSLSDKCDWEENVSEYCSMNAEDMYKTELIKAEIAKLNEEKINYEIYIENPSKSRLFNSANAQTHIWELTEKCMSDATAIDSTLTNDKYYKYKESVCEPNAKKDFVKPQNDILQKIVARLEILNGTNNNQAEKPIHVTTQDTISPQAVSSSTQTNASSQSISNKASENSSAEWYKVKAKPNLVMRSVPSVTGEKIRNIPYDDKVRIIEKTDESDSIGGQNGTWAKIQWKDDIGYAFDAFLEPLNKQNSKELE